MLCVLLIRTIWGFSGFIELNGKGKRLKNPVIDSLKKYLVTTLFEYELWLVWRYYHCSLWDCNFSSESGQRRSGDVDHQAGAWDDVRLMRIQLDRPLSHRLQQDHCQGMWGRPGQEGGQGEALGTQQVWSLTQFYSVGFLQSRAIVNKKSLF